MAPLATASYNWLPNQHSKELLFFVMFGRDELTNLKHLINHKLRYMGMEDLILDLELMSNIYQVQIHNLKWQDNASWKTRNLSLIQKSLLVTLS